MIRTPYIEINRACSLRHWAYRTCVGATSILDDSEINGCLVWRTGVQSHLRSSKASAGGGSLGGNVPFY